MQINNTEKIFSKHEFGAKFDDEFQGNFNLNRKKGQCHFNCQPKYFSMNKFNYLFKYLNIYILYFFPGMSVQPGTMVGKSYVNAKDLSIVFYIS